jgi:hypothetical protein
MLLLRQDVEQEAVHQPPLSQFAEPEGEPGPAEVLQKLDERLRHWQAWLDQAEPNTSAVDEQMRADYEALSAWREQARKARERLAEWASRPLSVSRQG